ncbi:hypothetical protein B0H66DRAFT_562214 [Apodospora peruviana]|uniref:Fungal N-terminal domain-containing protein n=1 Tax=Apodospora peruviana TaxID=516989 RepID=A0AAE0I1Z9_9PEZI|nr:hypothetical protein B0H66DRAFT_562214 [Apodospora peruviana]
MSVGFGFSAGDFIAGLELVATIIDALRESGDSGRRYRELIRELYSLETALLQVKRLQLHESQNAEQIALRSAASQCQRTITEFWETAQKYHPSLGRSSSSPSTLRDQWMKLKWALLKEDDVEKFKADLRGHTGSINLLLSSCHMQSQAIEAAKREGEQKSLMALIQMSANQWMGHLSQITSTTASIYNQGKDLLQMTSRVVQTNIHIFHAVLDLQAWIKHIPGQVQHQQPVIFLDALGGQRHFQLDFIQSADALRAVIREIFKRAGVGVGKIDRGEFALRDKYRAVDIDLAQTWERCFRPGQTVEMSMIFALASEEERGSSCPTCGEVAAGRKADEQVECSQCGMVFSRIVELDNAEENAQAPSEDVLSLRPRQRPLPPHNHGSEAEHDEREDVAIFRRVRISLLKRHGDTREASTTINTVGPLRKAHEDPIEEWVRRYTASEIQRSRMRHNLDVHIEENTLLKRENDLIQRSLDAATRLLNRHGIRY